jgi:mRNA interferase RelE/StbE
MGSYRVEFAKSATKDLRGIDRKWIPKILEAAERLEFDPRPAGCKKLVGSDQTYRIRVGDYRVIYEVVGETLIVLVVRIRHRSGAYR